MAALALSTRLVGLPLEEARQGRQILKDFGLTRTWPPLKAEAVLKALPFDKKRQEEGLVFVVLKRLGQAVIQEKVPLPLVAEALEGIIGGGG